MLLDWLRTVQTSKSAWQAARQAGELSLQISDDHIFIDGREAGNADQLPAFWSELGAEAYAGLPLGSPEKQTGLVCLGFLRAHPFTEESSAGLRQFSAQVGAAIERTRMLIKTRQREMDLSELAEMARMMISTLDIEELLLRIATRLAVVTGMDSAPYPSLNRTRIGCSCWRTTTGRACRIRQVRARFTC